MLDASKGFIKDDNKNRLRSQDIHKIVDVFNKQLDLERYSRLVSLTEIASNDYNLNIPRYIDSSEPEDLHDLSAHLNGGIPNRDIDALADYWRVFPNLRSILFRSHNQRADYREALVSATQVKSTILNYPEFKLFVQQALTHFEQWQQMAKLHEITQRYQPKEIIQRISESLLARYAQVDLLDKYDIYQILMDYWAEVMQDDVYVITQDGWQAGRALRQIVTAKGEKSKKTADLMIDKIKYQAELISPSLIVDHYFKAGQTKVTQLQTELDIITQNLESYLEEHGGDEGLLSDMQTKKNAKEVQDALDKAVFAQYAVLNEEEIKVLVVQDKWLATLRQHIQAEIERLTQQLTNRIKVLEERYAEPLPKIMQQVDEISSKVAEHLKKMGLAWEPVA
jgi:type I restriction enzyme M protein